MMNTVSLVKMSVASLMMTLVAGCSEYGDFTQEQICRASLAAVKGKSPTIMTIEEVRKDPETEREVFFISYKRPDDGKKWHYKCRIVRTRAVLAQGKEGRWRDQAQDPTIRFQIEGQDLHINETFPDGSTAMNVTYSIYMLGGKPSESN
ncbi:MULTISPECIES: hypothetical protein [Grimontia]|uniref:Lipoprotein n=1 Tax=Grimontia marina TaxID=646534 RepID=A0A128FCC3_9GAMM|nr:MULTISPECIES: hypothetical protein [Grimontia]WRV99074.1 hypothetical protein VP504_06565 [Grimontia sp. NTOU-MAR1]CZF83931.1 hypothetical protein GMA8713_02881 [Grimontia marina]